MEKPKADAPIPLRSLATAQEKSARIREIDARIDEGGGAKAIEKLHARGKHTGWERIEMLCDPGSFSEMDKMMGSHRGVHRGNTITGHGLIDGRPVVVVSNMSESKAGAWYGESVFKTLRAQEFSFQHRIPIVFLVDSASAYLPEQEDVHSGSRHGGRVFHYLANHSGIFPQVAGVFGASVRTLDCVFRSTRSLVPAGPDRSFRRTRSPDRSEATRMVWDQCLGGSDAAFFFRIDGPVRASS